MVTKGVMRTLLFLKFGHRKKDNLIKVIYSWGQDWDQNLKSSKIMLLSII